MADTETNTIPLTLLEAVNVMLKAIGQAQVMSLQAADTNSAAQDAVQALSDASRMLQQTGWHCNTEEEYPLTPNLADGFVYLPSNTAQVTTSARSAALDITQRGNRLYNRRTHTFAFDAVVYMDIVFNLEFSDLPPFLRWAITTSAAWRWGVGRVPDATTYRFTRELADAALAEARHADQEARSAFGFEQNPHYRRQRRR